MVEIFIEEDVATMAARLLFVFIRVYCSSLICRVFVMCHVPSFPDACLPRAVTCEECCLVSGGVDLICARLALF